MAYLEPAFKYDIFVSYAHVDDPTPPNNAAGKGWVTLFLEYLEQELRRNVARSVEVWSDKRKIGSNTAFDDEIKKSIDESALFIALTSVGYFDKECYCPKELERFHSKAGDETYGHMIGTRRRIFNVLLQNIDFEEWPAAFEGTVGLPFHDSKLKDRLGRTLAPGSDAFNEGLGKLMDDIVQTMHVFKAKVEGEPSRTRSRPLITPGKYTVFLGHAEGDLVDVRSRVRKELEEKNISVADYVPPPFDAKGHEQAVLAALGSAQLSVHLLDAGAGMVIHDDPERKTYYGKQVELAMEHSKSQMIWVPKAVEIPSVANESHRLFLEKLDRESRDSQDRAAYDFIQEPLTDITAQILAKLRRLDEDATSAHRRLGDRALLDTHHKDEKYASSLSRVLQKRVRDLFINPSEGEPLGNMRLLAKLLKRVSLLFIIFGTVDRDWVQHRLKTFVQIAVEKRCSLKLCGVYLAPVAGSEAERGTLDDVLAPFPVYLFESLDDLPDLLDVFLSDDDDGNDNNNDN